MPSSKDHNVLASVNAWVYHPNDGHSAESSTLLAPFQAKQRLSLFPTSAILNDGLKEPDDISFRFIACQAGNHSRDHSP